MSRREVIENDIVWQKILSDLNVLERTKVDTGVIGSENFMNEEGVPIIKLALIHEFGTSKIPQRSFIRQGFDANKENINAQADKVIDAVFKLQSFSIYLNRLGLIMVDGTVQQFDNSGNPSWPANSAATVAQKGSDKPLIDKGFLRASISYRIQ